MARNNSLGTGTKIGTKISDTKTNH
jgi:hypothetical protein